MFSELLTNGWTLPSEVSTKWTEQEEESEVEKSTEGVNCTVHIVLLQMEGGLHSVTSSRSLWCILLVPTL